MILRTPQFSACGVFSLSTERGIDKGSWFAIIEPESGNMKKITKQKPFFNKQGDFYLPNDLKFGGQVNPPLNPKEWFFLLLTIADKSQISKEKEEKLFNNLIGSKTNFYRIKRSLKSKGYL